MARREPTKEDVEAAKNLKRIWLEKKDELKITQADIARRMNWASPSAMSQYINCKVPLGAETIISLAEILNVDPKDIKQSLDIFFIPKDSMKFRYIPVMGDDKSGYTSKVIGSVSSVGYTPSQYALLCTKDVLDIAEAGEILLMIPSIDAEQGEDVSIKYKESNKHVHTIGYIKRKTKAYTVIENSDGKSVMIRTGDIEYCHHIGGVLNSRFFEATVD